LTLVHRLLCRTLAVMSGTLPASTASPTSTIWPACTALLEIALDLAHERAGLGRDLLGRGRRARLRLDIFADDPRELDLGDWRCRVHQHASWSPRRPTGLRRRAPPTSAIGAAPIRRARGIAVAGGCCHLGFEQRSGGCAFAAARHDAGLTCHGGSPWNGGCSRPRARANGGERRRRGRTGPALASQNISGSGPGARRRPRRSARRSSRAAARCRKS
jgi:hypothetical protein